MDRWVTFIKGGKCALGAVRTSSSSSTTCSPPQLPPVLSVVNPDLGGVHALDEMNILYSVKKLFDAKLCG